MSNVLLANRDATISYQPHIIALALGGKYSNEIFTRKGTLRNIQKLRYWGIREVLTDKYLLDPREAETLADFLMPMVSPISFLRGDNA